MESVETLIPDNEGNHLVVVLNFYEDSQKADTFQMPPEFAELEIADISIEKLYLDRPLGLRAFHRMYHWLLEQFVQYPNAVFSFICSTEPLETNHKNIAPEKYRWNLFEYFYKHHIDRLKELGIESKDIIVGPDDYQSFARVFYRTSHAPIIHVVIAHLENKYH